VRNAVVSRSSGENTTLCQGTRSCHAAAGTELGPGHYFAASAKSG
jgi:hypothetical protein